MTISVVIPVLHEKAVINSTIRHVRSIEQGRPVDIVVADGSAEGDTIQAVTDRTVKCVLSEQGRGKQMNRGARETCGEIILFLHADTRLPHDAFPKISTVISGGFAAGAFDLGIEADGFAFRLIERVGSLRSRLTRIPFGDQAIFVRRQVFSALGGYGEMAIMEDVDLMRRIKRAGYRCFIVSEKVRTSGRRWKKEGVVRCTLRNWCLMALYLLGVSPGKLVKWYPELSSSVKR